MHPRFAQRLLALHGCGTARVSTDRTGALVAVVSEHAEPKLRAALVAAGMVGEQVDSVLGNAYVRLSTP